MVNYKHKKFLFIFTLSFFLLVNNLYASNIGVVGKSYNPISNCAYFSTIEADFDITYYNDWTRWGDKVFLVYAFDDLFSTSSIYERSWVREKKVEIFAEESYKWKIRLHETVSQRSSFSYNHLKFYFIIKNAEGKEHLDKGFMSLGFGHYEVTIPRTLTCGPGSGTFEELKVDIIRE